MDIKVMYSDDESKRQEAIMKYSSELQSRDILLLISAATSFYNILVPQHDKIDIKTVTGTCKEERALSAIYNLKSLQKYNVSEIGDPNIFAKDVKSFLIKMHYMAYQQYMGSEVSKCLNWGYFETSLHYISNEWTELGLGG